MLEVVTFEKRFFCCCLGVAPLEYLFVTCGSEILHLCASDNGDSFSFIENDYYIKGFGADASSSC